VERRPALRRPTEDSAGRLARRSSSVDAEGDLESRSSSTTAMAEKPTPNESVRLNRFLASCGLGSRRGCEAIIKAARVSIDGEICTSLGARVNEGQMVKLDGRIVRPSPPQTIAFHKPKGLLCTHSDELGRDTIYAALPESFSDLRHVGRLDQESEGLLILTRDGDLANRLTHPSSKLEKEYLVTLDQPFEAQHHGDRLRHGIELEDEGKARAKSFLVLSPRRLQVVLTQGKKRQIRRMFEAIGYRVRKLVRVRIGSVEIGEKLQAGKWRALGSEELRALETNPDPLDPTAPVEAIAGLTRHQKRDAKAHSLNPPPEKTAAQKKRAARKRPGNSRRQDRSGDRRSERDDGGGGRGSSSRRGSGTSRGSGTGRGSSNARGRGANSGDSSERRGSSARGSGGRGRGSTSGRGRGGGRGGNRGRR